MDDNFSPKVKDVITYSKEEALRLGHDFIGTEHLILGLIRGAQGKAIDILNFLDVDLNSLRKKVESLNPVNFEEEKKYFVEDSIRSISFIVTPALSKAFSVAGRGPEPILVQSTPATALLLILNFGFRSNSFALSSFIIIPFETN